VNKTSTLTQEEKETFDVSLCKPETYAEILDNLTYYQRKGNHKAIEAFSSLKKRMESQCDMKPIHRALGMRNHSHIVKPTPKKFIMKGMDILEIHENGTISFYMPEKETIKIPEPLNEAQLALRNLEAVNYEEERRKQLFPEICTPNCPHRTCGYYRQENFGKPCQMRFEQYKTAPSQFETRTLDPNEPDYHSPQFREEKTEKPKKEMKESLNPSC